MNRQILRLAGPNIISNISIPLLGIVDMALMGHLESDTYIGAIALGSLIFNFLYWSLGFLRMGTSGFTAQAFGRKDFQEAVFIFSRAMLIALSMSAVLLLFQGPIEWLSFRILKGEAEVEQLALQYFRIRIWAAPAALGQFALLGFFLGMQNAKQPMLVLVSTNVINIVANYVLVMVMGRGSDGVAIGTVIAQYSGFLIALCILFLNYRRLFRQWSRAAVLKLDELKKFLQVNGNIFIRTFCLVIVFSFFTASSASTDLSANGEGTILAVNSLLMQFFMFFSFLIDGFAHAAEALVGRLIGAKDEGALKRLIRILFYWGAGIGVLFSLLYLVGGDLILRLLTNNVLVLVNAGSFMIWVIVIPIVSFTAFLWDGIFIGATAGKAMRNAMLISMALFFLGYYVLDDLIGNHGLWLAFVVFMGARGLSMTIMWNQIPKSLSTFSR